MHRGRRDPLFRYLRPARMISSSAATAIRPCSSVPTVTVASPRSGAKPGRYRNQPKIFVVNMGDGHRANANGESGERLSVLVANSKGRQDRLHHTRGGDGRDKRRTLQGLYQAAIRNGISNPPSVPKRATQAGAHRAVPPCRSPGRAAAGRLRRRRSSRTPETLPRMRPVQVESARSFTLGRQRPRTMMPSPTKKRTSGRPSPSTISRAGPPPSGSLGMSPSDCTININSGIAVASKQDDRGPAAPLLAGSDAAVSLTAAVRLQRLTGGGPKPRRKPPVRAPAANRTERRGPIRRRGWKRPRQEPAKTTRDHGSPKSQAPARSQRLRAWAPRRRPSLEARGVSRAKAAAGEAPIPAIRPKSAASLVDPSHRQRSIFAVSQSEAAVLSARPATRPAPTITSPGE